MRKSDKEDKPDEAAEAQTEEPKGLQLRYLGSSGESRNQETPLGILTEGELIERDLEGRKLSDAKKRRLAEGSPFFALEGDETAENDDVEKGED